MRRAAIRARAQAAGSPRAEGTAAGHARPDGQRSNSISVETKPGTTPTSGATAAGGLSNQFGPRALRKLSCAHASAGAGHTARAVRKCRRTTMIHFRPRPTEGRPSRFPFAARHAKPQKRGFERIDWWRKVRHEFPWRGSHQILSLRELRDRSVKWPTCLVHRG